MRKLILLCVLAGCSAAAPGAADAPPTFLAFTPDFAQFRTWTSVHSDGPTPGTVPDDVLGPRTQYLNHAPPAGSTEFPVGTIIVEARENSLKKIFAGVKRGGDYNPQGARDWEWFELSESASGVVSLLWRGVGPPNGDTYGGDVNGCNVCHAACAANDYVCSPLLSLGSFR
jgi:hypothetical protein